MLEFEFFHLSIVFSDWRHTFWPASAPALSSRCSRCPTAACFSSHTTLTFNTAKAKLNTHTSFDCYYKKSIWLCLLKPAASQRKEGCVCVGVCWVSPFIKASIWCSVEAFGTQPEGIIVHVFPVIKQPPSRFNPAKSSSVITLTFCYWNMFYIYIFFLNFPPSLILLSCLNYSFSPL